MNPALVAAAAAETARIYSRTQPEHRNRRIDDDQLADEIDHFHAFGWSIKRIADRLELSEHRVTALMRRGR